MSKSDFEWNKSLLGDVFKVSSGDMSMTKSTFKTFGFTAFSASGPDGFVEEYQHEGEGIVVSSVGAKAGKVFKASGRWTAIKNTIVIERANDQFDIDYLFYCLSIKGALFQEGGAQPFISQKEIIKTEIKFPPLLEQKKISNILSNIDKLISTTQTKIIKYKFIKKSLLSSLIGNLNSEVKLDYVAKRVSGHTPSKSKIDYWNGGIPWVSLTDTSKLDNRYISNTAKEISKLGIENSSAVLHPPGTVIISRDARVGCSAVTTKSMAVSQHFIGWICSKKLNNMFLYYLLQSWKSRFENIAIGSTIPTIGVSFFKDLVIPLPPLTQQINIAKTLEFHDISIKSLENKVQFFKNLKIALMEDLLSGRKRVKV